MLNRGHLESVLPEIAREMVVLTVVVGGEESEYDVSGEEAEERVTELMAMYTRSRESQITICVKRIKRRGMSNGC
jgi:hypothetical protein